MLKVGSLAIPRTSRSFGPLRGPCFFVSLCLGPPSSNQSHLGLIAAPLVHLWFPLSGAPFWEFRIWPTFCTSFKIQLISISETVIQIPPGGLGTVFYNSLLPAPVLSKRTWGGSKLSLIVSLCALMTHLQLLLSAQLLLYVTLRSNRPQNLQEWGLYCFCLSVQHFDTQQALSVYKWMTDFWPENKSPTFFCVNCLSLSHETFYEIHSKLPLKHRYLTSW